jgi:predicted membrane GTPase involved in stress response
MATSEPEPSPLLDPLVDRHLEPNETVHAAARAADAFMAVSDRRLLVVAGERLTLNLPIEDLRRVEFDIEKGRPATVVIVPEAATIEPQVLLIPDDQLEAAAQALAVIAARLVTMFGPWRGSLDQ